MSKIDDLRKSNPFYAPPSKRQNKALIRLPNKKHLRRKIRKEDEMHFIIIRRQRLVVVQDGEFWDVLAPAPGYNWPPNIALLGW